MTAFCQKRKFISGRFWALKAAGLMSASSMLLTQHVARLQKPIDGFVDLSLPDIIVRKMGRTHLRLWALFNGGIYEASYDNFHI